MAPLAGQRTTPAPRATARAASAEQSWPTGPATAGKPPWGAVGSAPTGRPVAVRP
ncbi:hypothetical protein ACFWPV_04540 [Streptomyces uncialis]|uniref:hypothetical protein n=1 Tax=Streptomyces uncialis TaxID=1048205 RepID=UPI00365CC8B3